MFIVMEYRFVLLSIPGASFKFRDGDRNDRMSSQSFAAKLFCLGLAGLFLASAFTASAQSQTTATPIKHVVVIFDENQSFDHYFGTYPVAANPQDEPPSKPRPARPRSTGPAESSRTTIPIPSRPIA